MLETGIPFALLNSVANVHTGWAFAVEARSSSTAESAKLDSRPIPAHEATWTFTYVRFRSFRLFLSELCWSFARPAAEGAWNVQSL